MLWYHVFQIKGVARMVFHVYSAVSTISTWRSGFVAKGRDFVVIIYCSRVPLFFVTHKSDGEGSAGCRTKKEERPSDIPVCPKNRTKKEEIVC